MKKFRQLIMGIAVLAAATASTAGCRAADKRVSVDQLPENARNFISAHFEGVRVTSATVDQGDHYTTYEVIFVDGSKAEFDKAGNWKEIDCRYGRVPQSAVPAPIKSYVDSNFPGTFVTVLERGSDDYEAKLSNGLELKFDMNFKLTKIDD